MTYSCSVCGLDVLLTAKPCITCNAPFIAVYIYVLGIFLWLCL